MQCFVVRQKINGITSYKVFKDEEVAFEYAYTLQMEIEKSGSKDQVDHPEEAELDETTLDSEEE